MEGVQGQNFDFFLFRLFYSPTFLLSKMGSFVSLEGGGQIMRGGGQIGKIFSKENLEGVTRKGDNALRGDPLSRPPLGKTLTSVFLISIKST